MSFYEVKYISSGCLREVACQLTLGVLADLQNNTTDTIQYNTVQCNTIQYSTIQYSTVQYNTIQYNANQYNAIQYSAIQYNASSLEPETCV